MTDYQHISVKPLSGALGAEIEGVDLRDPFNDVTLKEINHAFLDHYVLFFRDQHLQPSEYLAFGRQFGELNVLQPLVGPNGLPEIMRVTKEPDDDFAVGHVWHSDAPYAEIPPKASALYAIEVPERGGDTLFANMYAAYDFSIRDDAGSPGQADSSERGAVHLHGPGRKTSIQYS